VTTEGEHGEDEEQQNQDADEGDSAATTNRKTTPPMPVGRPRGLRKMFEGPRKTTIARRQIAMALPR
jgi:hypothetical protein